MKKQTILKSAMLLAFIFMTFAVSAQNAFVESMTTIRDEWVRPSYPILAGIVFLVGIATNLGSLFGENRDVKKVVINILTYLGVCLVVVGVYEAITAITV